MVTRLCPTFTPQTKEKVTSVTQNAFLQLISVKEESFSSNYPLMSHWPELVLKLASYMSVAVLSSCRMEGSLLGEGGVEEGRGPVSKEYDLWEFYQ